VRPVPKICSFVVLRSAPLPCTTGGSSREVGASSSLTQVCHLSRAIDRQLPLCRALTITEPIRQLNAINLTVQGEVGLGPVVKLPDSGLAVPVAFCRCLASRESPMLLATAPPRSDCRFETAHLTFSPRHAVVSPNRLLGLPCKPQPSEPSSSTGQRWCALPSMGHGAHSSLPGPGRSQCKSTPAQSLRRERLATASASWFMRPLRRDAFLRVACWERAR